MRKKVIRTPTISRSASSAANREPRPARGYSMETCSGVSTSMVRSWSRSRWFPISLMPISRRLGASFRGQLPDSFPGPAGGRDPLARKEEAALGGRVGALREEVSQPRLGGASLALLEERHRFFVEGDPADLGIAHRSGPAPEIE